MVFASDSHLAVGLVLADADDRQGYFWMHRGGLVVFRGSMKSQRDDLCIPFAAIESVERLAAVRTEVHLTISRAEIEELPERWQTQPQPSVQEMIRSLPVNGGMAQQPMMGTGGFPIIPQLPAFAAQQPAIPMPGAPSFADAQALGETVVNQFSQKAELIRAIARIQAAIESEQIPDTHKQMLAQEATAAYERLQTITEQTDAQMGAYLSRNGR